MSVTVSMTLNGKQVSADVEPRTLLVQYIREHIGLTGTHVGCDTSQCGACVVHVGGKSVKSCTMLAVQAEGADVTTIEGLATNGELHPMQAAFRENHGLQCGFCTPGMIMSALDLVSQNSAPSDGDVREWLEVQDWRSQMPGPGQLLVESFPHAKRHYSVYYTFEGWNANQSLGMLITRRMEDRGLMPGGFVANDCQLAENSRIWLPEELLLSDIPTAGHRLIQNFHQLSGCHPVKTRYRQSLVTHGANPVNPPAVMTRA